MFKDYGKMKNIITVLLLLLVCSASLVAQVDPEDENLSWKAKLKKADQLYQNGSYYNAIDYYKAVLDEKPDNGDVAIKLGDTYLSGRNYIDAMAAYKQAFDADDKKYRIAQFYYGLMLKYTGSYQEAYDQLKEFSRKFRAPGKEAADLKKRARTEYEGAQLGLDYLKDTLVVIISHLSTNINKAYTEFSPKIIGENEDELIFGSLRVDSVIVLDEKMRSMPRARLFSSRKNGEDWTEAEELEGPFNDTKDHTGNGVYSPDGKRFYFTRCTDDKGSNIQCDIFMSVLDDDEWSNPKKLDINESKFNDTHPCIGMDKNTEILYFVSDREEGGQGGLDIWYSIVKKNGDHDPPRNLGRRINTPQDEISPYYDIKDGVMYFSSNGLINMGGFDIMKTKGSKTRWAKAKNLGMPINSSFDDMFYVQRNDGETGYFVSNRDGAITPKWPNCCDDIWAFEYIYPPVFTIMGRVYLEGDETKTPIDSANVELFLIEASAVEDSAVTDKGEQYEFFLGTRYENFRVEARKAGYISGLNTTSTVGLEVSDTLYVDLYLRKPVGYKVILRNVYFDFDKAFIREDAKPSLDTIYNFLTSNPHLKIELSSHTDSRGTKEYNRGLSQRRADSSTAYLISLGIDPQRIVAVGYGEDSLLNECADGVQCTDIEHQLNRRTEFRVIGEIPNTIIIYDRSEIEAIRKRKQEGKLKGTEEIWDFDADDDEEPLDEENP